MVVRRAFLKGITDSEVADGSVAGVGSLLDIEGAGCFGGWESNSQSHRVEDEADEDGHELVSNWSH